MAFFWNYAFFLSVFKIAMNIMVLSTFKFHITFVWVDEKNKLANEIEITKLKTNAQQDLD